MPRSSVWPEPNRHRVFAHRKATLSGPPSGPLVTITRSASEHEKRIPLSAGQFAPRQPFRQGGPIGGPGVVPPGQQGPPQTRGGSRRGSRLGSGWVPVSRVTNGPARALAIRGRSRAKEGWTGGRVVLDRVLAGVPPADRGGQDRTRCRRQEPAYEQPPAAGRGGGQGRKVGLPVLRGRVRPGSLRERRPGHADRGRPGLAGQPGQAVPEGIGEPAAHHRPAHVSTRCSTGAPSGTEWEHLGSGHRHGHGRRQGDRRAAGWLAVARTKARVFAARSGFASLGGATLDNEENYLIKKLFTALGAIQIENQARI